MVATELSQLTAGVEVEVRTRFTATWAPGFEVVHVVGDRVHIRRRSDGVVLPVALRLDDVRPTRSRPERERKVVHPTRRPA
jgi:hypothetical protein